jgi:hypothetical protein
MAAPLPRQRFRRIRNVAQEEDEEEEFAGSMGMRGTFVPRSGFAYGDACPEEWRSGVRGKMEFWSDCLSWLGVGEYKPESES